MTTDQFVSAVYAELPARKHLVGRARCERIIRRALKTWPAPVLFQCDAQQTEVVGKYFARTLERHERAEYGMGFLVALVLSALISEIVKALVRRWLENRTSMLEAIR